MSEQWIATPSRSALARPLAFEWAIAPCGDLMPEAPFWKTLATSPVALVLVFSSSMLAYEKAPTEQPARVNVTHGAGVFCWPVVIMLGKPSLIGSVQYENAELKLVEFGLPLNAW